MTTKPEHPVVEALEEAKHVFRHIKEVCDSVSGYPDFAVIPKTVTQITEALPLARELVEHKEGLEWILRQAEGTMFGRCLTSPLVDCPAIIKRLIGERT